MRQSRVERPIISFLAEALQHLARAQKIACISISETAAEKFAALTRRIGAEMADAGGTRDPILVRHVCDVQVMRSDFDSAEVASLARAIISDDMKAYGHQFPAYREDPIRETLRPVEGLATIRSLPIASAPSTGRLSMAAQSVTRIVSARSANWPRRSRAASKINGCRRRPWRASASQIIRLRRDYAAQGIGTAGDVDTNKAILRNYIKTTAGFEKPGATDPQTSAEKP